MNEEPADMTDAKRAVVGEQLARILKLRRSKGTSDRYDTEWGNKTALGVYMVAQRLMRGDCV